MEERISSPWMGPPWFQRGGDASHTMRGEAEGLLGEQPGHRLLSRVSVCDRLQSSMCTRVCVPVGAPGPNPLPQSLGLLTCETGLLPGARAACARGQPARPLLPGSLLPCSDPVLGPPASSSTPCGAWVPTAGLQPCPRSRPRAPAEPPTAGSGSSSVEGAMDPDTRCG